MGLIFGGVSASDLIMDGQSVSLYVGGNPPTKVWPTGPDVVKITLGDYREAQAQLQAALSSRGLDHATVTEIPFGIELVGTGSVRDMFAGFALLTSAPVLDTSQVTDMRSMFYGCAALTYVPNMIADQVLYTGYMFFGCTALTDGKVRLIGKHPNVNTMSMTLSSGLTRHPFYSASGIPI